MQYAVVKWKWKFGMTYSLRYACPLSNLKSPIFDSIIIGSEAAFASILVASTDWRISIVLAMRARSSGKVASLSSRTMFSMPKARTQRNLEELDMDWIW